MDLSLEDLLSGLEAAQQKKSKVRRSPRRRCQRCWCPAKTLPGACIPRSDVSLSSMRHACMVDVPWVHLLLLLAVLLSSTTARPSCSLPSRAQTRLSERNVVELVVKLKALGLLGEELLYTTNGKEYVTRERAALEVGAAVRAAGGRIPLVRAAWRLALMLLRRGSAKHASLHGKSINQSPMTSCLWVAGSCMRAQQGPFDAACCPAPAGLPCLKCLSISCCLHPPWQVDLPSQLGLDLVHCERAADAVVASSDGAITLSQAGRGA